MIFFLYSNWVRERKGFPEVNAVSGKTEFDNLGFQEKAMAETIFTFKNGKTIYLKNRFINPANGYQYSEEEMVVLKLKAVLL